MVVHFLRMIVQLNEPCGVLRAVGVQPLEFIPKGLIVDAVLLVHEVVHQHKGSHGHHHSSTVGHLTVNHMSAQNALCDHTCQSANGWLQISRHSVARVTAL